MFLADNGVVPGQQWNQYWLTVEQLLQAENLEVPMEWKCDQNILDCLDDYCKKYNIKDYNIVLFNPLFTSKLQTKTFPMFLSERGYVPPKCCSHDVNIKDNFGNSIKRNLQQYGYKYEQKQFKHDGYTELENWDLSIKQQYYQFCASLGMNRRITIPVACAVNQYQRTFAMYLAMQGIIPPQRWEHKPELEDKSGHTVSFYLLQSKICPPRQWVDDPSKTYYNNLTTAMIIANELKQEPPSWWFHDTTKRDDHNNTVAMFLAKNRIVPSRRWSHDPELQNSEGHTVASYLEEYGIETPYFWKHRSTYQMKKGFTIAMLTARIGKVPEEFWYHNPSTINDYGKTVAMYLAQNGIIPPPEWQHDPSIQDYWGNTVAILLASHGITPPSQWYHDPTICNKDGKTVGIFLTIRGYVPTKHWMHDVSNIKDKNECSIRSNLEKYGYTYQDNQFVNNRQTTVLIIDGVIRDYYYQYCNIHKLCKQIVIRPQCYSTSKFNETFAMFLAERRVDPPELFYHCPTIQNKQKNTVALILAQNGITPGVQWVHNNELTSSEFETVALLLTKQGIVPPSYWIHGVDVRRNDRTLRNEKFIINTLQEERQDVCENCRKHQQFFVKTKCNDNVCRRCLNVSAKQQKHMLCPVCQKLDWFQPIDEEMYQKYLDFKRNEESM